MTASPSSLALSPTQFGWAQKIVAHIKSRMFTGDDGTYGQRIADIALATALVESGLRMYANGNNADSLKLPHDAVGWDHGSVGLFQQQVGGARNSTANWGTTEQLMNVNTSTDAFVNALLRTNWLHMTNGAVAQAVQGSAFPDRYAQMDPRAVEIRTALWGGTAAPASAPKPAPRPLPPRFPLKPGQYFGPRLPLWNLKSVSGYFTHNADLKRWQATAKARGFYHGIPDGHYGPLTAAAALEIQTHHRLTRDKLIGPATWRATFE